MDNSVKHLAGLYALLMKRRREAFLPEGNFLQRLLAPRSYRPADRFPEDAVLESMVTDMSGKAFPGLNGVVAGPGGPGDITHSVSFGVEKDGSPRVVFQAVCRSRGELHSEFLEYDGEYGLIPSYQHYGQPDKDRSNRRYAYGKTMKSREHFSSLSPRMKEVFQKLDFFRGDFHPALRSSLKEGISVRDFRRFRDELSSWKQSYSEKNGMAPVEVPSCLGLEDFVSRRRKMFSDIRAFLEGRKPNSPEARSRFAAESAALSRFQSEKLGKALLFERSVEPDRPTLQGVYRHLEEHTPGFGAFHFSLSAREFGYEPAEIREVFGRLAPRERLDQDWTEEISRGVRTADRIILDGFVSQLGETLVPESPSDFIRSYSRSPVKAFLRNERKMNVFRCVDHALLDRADLKKEGMAVPSLERLLASRLVSDGQPLDDITLGIVNSGLDGKGLCPVNGERLETEYFSRIGTLIGKVVDGPGMVLRKDVASVCSGLNPMGMQLMMDVFSAVVSLKDDPRRLSSFVRESGMQFKWGNEPECLDLVKSCVDVARGMYGRGTADDLARVQLFRRKYAQEMSSQKIDFERKPAVKSAESLNLKNSRSLPPR